MLTTTNTGLLVVDIQGKLARLVEGSDALIANTARLGAGARLLGLPVVWLEQNPDKLGATVPELQLMQTGDLVLPKHSFGALGEPALADALARQGVSHWLVCGIEAHICVYQTVQGLLDAGSQVSLVVDAVVVAQRRQPGARHPQAGGPRGRTHLGGDVPLRAAGRLPPSGVSRHSGVDQIALLSTGPAILPFAPYCWR